MTTAIEARASLMQGLAVQTRTIGALIMRELHTRFGRDNIGYLWLFLEPALLATGVALIHVWFGLRLPFGMQVVPFYVTGYTAYLLFRSTANRAGTTLEANGSLLYHRSVTIFDMLLARALLETVATMMAGLLLIAGATAVGLAHLPADPLLFLVGWMLNLWFCLGISMLALAGCVVFRSLDRFIHPATYLLMPISGAFLIFEQAPPAFRYLLTWIPLAHIEQIIREGEFGFESHDTDPLYVVIWCAALTLLGLLALHAVRPRIELE
jgi:capsular polysaccharide transport system permease protein